MQTSATIYLCNGELGLIRHWIRVLFSINLTTEGSLVNKRDLLVKNS